MPKAEWKSLIKKTWNVRFIIFLSPFVFVLIPVSVYSKSFGDVKHDCALLGQPKDPNSVITPAMGAHIDSCTYEEQSNEKTMEWRDIGETVSNCQNHGGQSITQQRTGTTTFSSTWTVGIDLGLSGIRDLLDIKVNGSRSWTESKAVANSSTITIPPGNKGSLTVGAEMYHSKGRLKANYNTQVDGHYIWYSPFEFRTPTGKTETGQEIVTCDKKLMNGQ